VLTTQEIARRLLVDGEGGGWDAAAGDVLTVDLHRLDGALGLSLARAALEEWSLLTGLRFEEVSFAGTLLREGADAPDGPEGAPRLAAGDAFEGRIEPGDADWVRVALDDPGLHALQVEEWGPDGLAEPVLEMRLAERGADGPGIVAPHGAPATARGNPGFVETLWRFDLAQIEAYDVWLRVSGRDGAAGAYRLSVLEADPGERPDITVREPAEGAAHADRFRDEAGRLTHAAVEVPTSWLEPWEAADTWGPDAVSTYLHEMGHALGLEHPGDYDGVATYEEDAAFANDGRHTSVMSYFWQSESSEFADATPFSPMEADGAAALLLYGPHAVRAGDTVYGQGSTAGGTMDLIARDPDGALAIAIRDDGGEDALRLEGLGQAGKRLDLRPGARSDVWGAGTLLIAEGTVIEHASTGEGPDTILGNAASNRLTAGAGDDDIRGGGGDDVLGGGPGSDRLTGGPGHDAFAFAGAFGSDVVTDFGPGDRIEIAADAPALAGLSAEGADALLTFAGGASIRLTDRAGIALAETREDGALRLAEAQEPGGLTLRGGPSADVLAGGSGGDRIVGRDGEDRLEGGAGGDRIKGGAGDDRLFGGAGDDRLRGGAGDDRLEGGPGSDKLIGGSGADRFVLREGFGRDRILDFAPGEDRIDLRGLVGDGDALGAALRQEDDRVELRLGEDRLILRDVELTEIGADDFIL
jgi:serralysin